MVDVDLLSFLSKHQIDKIVYAPGTAESVVNSGATTQAPQTAFIVEKRITNPYGKKSFVRARWSVDNGDNWQSLSSRLVYVFTLTIPAIPLSEELNGLQAALSIGVSDNEVIFRTASGYHGNVSDDGVTYTYTPISQTFLIEYALFEIE